jgi:hypothetical protein
LLERAVENLISFATIDEGGSAFHQRVQWGLEMRRDEVTQNMVLCGKILISYCDFQVLLVKNTPFCPRQASLR